MPSLAIPPSTPGSDTHFLQLPFAAIIDENQCPNKDGRSFIIISESLLNFSTHFRSRLMPHFTLLLYLSPLFTINIHVLLYTFHDTSYMYVQCNARLLLLHCNSIRKFVTN